MTDQEIRAIWNLHWDSDKTLSENVCKVVQESLKYQRRYESSKLNEKRS